MWVIFFFLKLLGAGIGLVFGLSGKKFGNAVERQYRTHTCYAHLNKHKGRIISRSVGLDHSGPKFRLVKEGTWDKFFKNWGLSSELQTGDQQFDDLVYVISDNPLLANHLSLSQETRDQIHSALSGAFTEVECDGERLWLTAKGSTDVSDGDMTRIVELSESMKTLKSEPVPMYREPFFYKAFVTEAVLYSLAGYAFAGFLEFAFTKETLLLDFNQQIWWGLGLAVGLFVALLSVVRTLFSGSSRGHRIIIESTILLVLSLPLAGVLLIEDINVGLDYSPDIEVTAVVRTMDKRYHKTKNGHYYTYHALFSRASGSEVELPTEISVSQDIYRSHKDGQELLLKLGKGTLGLPWVRSLRWKA